MVTVCDPTRAYRRVQRDAAIMGSDARALTLLCYDEFLETVGAALHADTRGSADARQQALNRALSAMSAIRSGMKADHPMTPVLGSIVTAADRALRGAMIRFNAHSIQTMHADFTDIREALAAT